MDGMIATICIKNINSLGSSYFIKVCHFLTLVMRGVSCVVHWGVNGCSLLNSNLVMYICQHVSQPTRVFTALQANMWEVGEQTSRSERSRIFRVKLDQCLVGMLVPFANEIMCDWTSYCRLGICLHRILIQYYNKLEQLHAVIRPIIR